MPKNALKNNAIFLTLDIELLKKIDKAAEFYHIRRNELIRGWLSDNIRLMVKDGYIEG
jgi:hypothetical protein